MATTYQWNDPHNKVLKKDVDGTVTYVPAVSGTQAYSQYLVWEAGAGQDVTAYRPNGYTGTVVQARITRVTALRQETAEYIRQKHYDFWVYRSAVDSGWTFTNTGSGDERTMTDTIEAVFATAAAMETAISGSSDIDAIRNSTVDFANNTHSL